MDSKIRSLFLRYKDYNGYEFGGCTIKDPESEALECGYYCCADSEEIVEMDLKVHLYLNHFDDYQKIFTRGIKTIQEIPKPLYEFIEPRKPQNYYLPTDIIRFIQKTAKPKLSWKLAHTAKVFVNFKIFEIANRLEYSDPESQWKTFNANHEDTYDSKTFEDKIVFLKLFRIQNSRGRQLQTFLQKTPAFFCFTEINIVRQNLSFKEYLYLTSTARNISLFEVEIRDSELQIVPLEVLLESLTSRISAFELRSSLNDYYTPQTFLKLSTMKFNKLQNFHIEYAPPPLSPKLICKFIENNPTLTHIRLYLQRLDFRKDVFHQYIKLWIDETYEEGFEPKYNDF